MPRVNVKDKRKQQLIDATMVSIAKRGLADTTITHVSEGANLSRGIVNFYFDSKEKMMQETLAYLVAEYNACWQEALAASLSQPPIARLEAVMKVLLADKQCSMRRLAAFSAFLGHAGTHIGYARMLRASDDLFVKQMKLLFQQAGIEAKKAEMRARQMLSFIRGHHLEAFLNADWGKPSVFSDSWADVLRSWCVSQTTKESAHVPVLQEKQASPRQKKPSSPYALPGQLDFADLFAKT